MSMRCGRGEIGDCDDFILRSYLGGEVFMVSRDLMVIGLDDYRTRLLSWNPVTVLSSCVVQFKKVMRPVG